MCILLCDLLSESTFKKLHIRNEVIEYLPTVLRIVARWWRVGFPDCAKRPVKDVPITAMDPRIGLELPQQTSQLRMAGDCVQPVFSSRVRACLALCLVTLNSPILSKRANHLTLTGNVGPKKANSFNFEPIGFGWLIYKSTWYKANTTRSKCYT